jgi:hypothetical protein
VGEESHSNWLCVPDRPVGGPIVMELGKTHQNQIMEPAYYSPEDPGEKTRRGCTSNRERETRGKQISSQERERRSAGCKIKPKPEY